MNPPRFIVDAEPGSQEAAALFMVHHLSLAAAYYEATEYDFATLVNMVQQYMQKNPMAANAATIWLKQMELEYIDEQPPANQH